MLPTIVLTTEQVLQSKIHHLRGEQVMIDRDLAELYGVDTKRLNEQVKRNIKRFPERFMFQLTAQEKNELVANCDRFSSLKHSTALPYAFTEQGVSMLSAVLKSDTAIDISIQIIDAFVSMRRFMTLNGGLLQRIDALEQHKLEANQKFDQLFRALDSQQPTPTQGIFFDGQIFDAYLFVNDRIRSATSSIVLVDNYIDDSVLNQLSKRSDGVSATLLTKEITARLAQDIKRHNTQYPAIAAIEFSSSHDRFLIIDQTVYHLGASLKDLGKKWFAFSKMDAQSLSIINAVNKVIEGVKP